mmetsp:Transcript_16358/g.22110  ORF Transcript_16358/g.22110 Transcript_16358/m.22110 type:complete len:88 (+) Transcript_16358:1-264(+)
MESKGERGSSLPPLMPAASVAKLVTEDTEASMSKLESLEIPAAASGLRRQSMMYHRKAIKEFEDETPLLSAKKPAPRRFSKKKSLEP